MASFHSLFDKGGSMNQDTFKKVDDFFSGLFGLDNDVMTRILANSHAAGLPAISISPCQGMFLQLLAQGCRARRILEIGTLGGYSGTWLARGLPDHGMLVTIESEARHAAIARQNFALAGVSPRITLINQDAKTALGTLIEQKAEPFDLVFIDADKQTYVEYLRLSLELAHPGTMIIADNVVRDGEIADVAAADERVIAVRKFCQALAENPRLASTALQTVGIKGYDGFSVSRVTS
jgi:predicted O-methyltransferase YrrM